MFLVEQKCVLATVPVPAPVAEVLGLKEQLQEALATGQLLDSGKGVTAPLPSMESSRDDRFFARSRGCDDVSPAVSMGEVSDLALRP